MQKTRGTALLAASLLLMGGLSACGDEGSGADESSSTTASPSAPEKTSSPEDSSTSEASEGSESSGSSDSSSGDSGEDEVAELPAAAKKQTKAGAIAFNEFYQDQMGETLRTGKVATLKEYSQGCDACDQYVKDTETANARGIKMDKNPNVIDSSTASKRVDSGYKVTIKVKAKEHHEVLSDGSRGRTADAVNFTIVTDTQWSSNHWVIRDSVIVE